MDVLARWINRIAKAACLPYEGDDTHGDYPDDDPLAGDSR
jgi:hypothetical protein